MLWATRLEAHALAERQVAATLLAAGAKDVELTDPVAERERFDAWLHSPLGSDRAKERLLAELGVA